MFIARAILFYTCRKKIFRRYFLSEGRLSDKLRCNVISDERGKPRVMSCLAAMQRLRFLRFVRKERSDGIAIATYIRQSAAASKKCLLSHTIHAAEFRHYVPHARQ